MKKNRKNTIFAFTLAEVLITLGIIGIVAAMTIPALMNNIQDNQLKQAWKKEFSTLYNATNRIMGDNGGSMANICSSLDPNCLRDAYADYLNVTKKCANGASYDVCWNYTDSDKNAWVANQSGLVLNDGTSLIFYYTNVDCSSTVFGPNTTRCGNIFIDVNGFKGPNRVGRDIQCIIVEKNSILPLGSGQVTLSGYGPGSIWTNSNDYLYN